MKRIRFALPSLFLVVALSALAQEEQPVEKTLPQLIGEIAEKENRQASDYQQIAQSTLHLGQQAKQSGQMLPEPAIYDALDAVEAGRALQPEAPIWDTLQSGLEELLKPNEQDQQQQQQQQQDQQQKQQQDEKQKEENSGQQQGSESESQSSEQSQEGQKPDGENQQTQESPSEDQENQKPSESQSEQNGDSQQGSGEQPQNQPRTDGAQLGDLDESQQQKPPELSKPSAAEPEQMQTLGGANKNEQPVNAQNAELTQMLEQLKQQDDPAKLFQLLQQAQSGEKKKQQPSGKDW